MSKNKKEHPELKGGEAFVGNQEATFLHCLLRNLKPIVRSIYKARYGVRGRLKPPINWNRTNSAWYRYRFAMWRREHAVYRWTGLPERWWSWLMEENEK